MVAFRTRIMSGEDQSLAALIGPGRLAQVINGTEGNNRLRGTDRADVISGLGGDDRIDGEDGDDRILGGAGNDRIEADDGDDTLIGGLGNDRLDGEDGDDTLTGGRGNDTFVFDDDNEADVVTDFSRQDFLYFDYQAGDDDAVYGIDDLTFTRTADGLLISFDDNHTVLLEGVRRGQIDDSQFLFNSEPVAAVDPVL